LGKINPEPYEAIQKRGKGKKNPLGFISHASGGDFHQGKGWEKSEFVTQKVRGMVWETFSTGIGTK